MTRGAYGVRVNGKDKIAYSISDSYPTSLGKRLLYIINGHDYKITTPILSKDDDTLPVNIGHRKTIVKGVKDINNKDDIIKKITLLADALSSKNVWVKKEQMFNFADFLYDSLMCEFAYIINLDENVFEIYAGFNTDKNASGRYANCNGYKTDGFDINHTGRDGSKTVKHVDGKTYYGVRLIVSIPLNDIRAMTLNDIDNFCEQLNRNVYIRYRRDDEDFSALFPSDSEFAKWVV